MTRHLWIDPRFGASGDMLLGALAGLADDPAVMTRDLSEALDTLGIDGWSIALGDAMRGGIIATRVEVTAGHGPARTWSSIDALIEGSDLPQPVRDGSRRTFRMLGDAEASLHGVDIDTVHFHEVGAVDAIVDIVGAWWLLDRLDVDDVTVGPVGIGHGTVTAAHGELPVPAPATVALLDGAPIAPIDVELETCTPTGAALLRSFGTWGPIPAGTIEAVARGAGGRDTPGHPNVTTAIMLETTRRPNEDAAPRTSAIVMSTNVDDLSAELIARTIERLITEGADDAWATPIVMKKGRPAHQISVLSPPERIGHLRAILSAETGSLGTRDVDVAKYPTSRRFDAVELHGRQVMIKVGPHGAKPEYDDLVALSDHTGVPVRVLADEAAAIWRSRAG